MKFKIEDKYPKKLAVKRNVEYAKLMMHPYAGEVSEDTAIHQYLYQSIILPDEMKEYKEILESIAKVEMQHLGILARTIKELGLYPVFADYSSKQNIFWNADYVDYEIYLEEMLKLDIKAEREAIKDYRMLLMVIDDPYVKETLTHIIKDEEIHLEIFTNLLYELEAD